MPWSGQVRELPAQGNELVLVLMVIEDEALGLRQHCEGGAEVVGPPEVRPGDRSVLAGEAR